MKTTDFINSYTEDAEYDDEAGSVKNNLHTIIRVSTHLERAIGDHENMPEWAQEKIAQVKGMIVSVMDYIISQHEMGKNEELPGFDASAADSKLSGMLDQGVSESSTSRYKVISLDHSDEKFGVGRNGKTADGKIQWQPIKGSFSNRAAAQKKADELNNSRSPVKEDATGGASCAGNMGAVVKELGEEGMTRKQVNKKLGGYTNIATKPKAVKVKGAY